MKRLRTILLFLLLGAVVNVGVAWGCVLVSDLKIVPELAPAEIRDLMSVQSLVDWNKHTVISSECYRSLGYERIELIDGKLFELPEDANQLEREWYEAELLDRSDEDPFLCRERVGWPFHCLQAWTSYSLFGIVAIDHGVEYRGPILPPPSGWPDVRRVLPLGIIPLGFLVNTLLYATLLWLLIPGPFALRRHLRDGRGLCVKCGYDLKGAEHEVCPECGHVIRGMNTA